MANNYTQWSEKLMFSEFEDTREKQKQWVRDVLTHRDDWEPPEGVEGRDLIDQLWLDRMKALGVDTKIIADEFWPDFDWKIESDHLWLYSEESGNLDNVIAFAQAFLRKFYPKGYFSLQWAEFCSAPRVGEFGGGGFVVTADKVICESTHTIVNRALDELGIKEEG